MCFKRVLTKEIIRQLEECNDRELKKCHFKILLPDGSEWELKKKKCSEKEERPKLKLIKRDCG